MRSYLRHTRSSTRTRTIPHRSNLLVKPNCTQYFKDNRSSSTYCSSGGSSSSNGSSVIEDKALKIRNSLAFNNSGTDSIQTFLDQSSALTWYSCGPTVYDKAHLGHARTYVCTDIIRRVMEDYFGMRLNYALGITDIDDKIINKGLSKGFTSWHPEMHDMVRNLEAEFFADMDKLNVRRPDAVLRVTEHMEEIIIYVSNLIQQGNAYVTDDGVYFSVASLTNRYDKFRPLPTAIDSDGNIDPTSLGGQKRDPRDFALWKLIRVNSNSIDGDFKTSTDCNSASKDNNDDNNSSGSFSSSIGGGGSKDRVSWPSPWGAGRPGWHIECSAMTHSYFGDHIDLHSGGVDLQFPHHTNEIAQCEAHNCPIHGTKNPDWVSVWLHTGHLHIKGRKMSKSLKNFISIQEYLDNTWRQNENMDSTHIDGDINASSIPVPSCIHAADDFRLFCLQHKYHSSLSFSEERMQEAVAYRHKVGNFINAIQHILSTAPQTVHCSRKPTVESLRLQKTVQDTQTLIRTALGNDFDTPSVLRALSGLVSEGTRFISHYNLIVSSSSSNNDSSIPPPVEPLLASWSLLGGTLHMLGLQFCPLKIGPLSSSSGTATGFGSGGRSPGDKLNDDISSTISAAVEFRSQVRMQTIGLKKEMKRAVKAAKKRASSEETEGKEQEQEQDNLIIAVDKGMDKMLGLCDVAREDWSGNFHIRIDDVSNGTSRWTPYD